MVVVFTAVLLAVAVTNPDIGAANTTHVVIEDFVVYKKLLSVCRYLAK